MSEITIDVNGRKYRMACEDGQEDHVRALAARFGTFVEALTGDFREAGDARLAIMAGITAVDELNEVEARMVELGGEIERLQGLIEASEDARRQEMADFAERYAQLAGRINDMAQELEGLGLT